jgi:dephospho-CoA kinase
MSIFSVGLTGGIGSGKSTIAAQLQRLGAAIVDADLLVHELVAPGGAAIDTLRAEFGPEALAADGGLDRPAMRARAFADPGIRRRLESILHPHVRAAAKERLAALPTATLYVVFVIPLLVESRDWTTRVHRVLVIDCTTSTQLARVGARPGIDASMALAILKTQADRSERVAAADDVIFNEAPLNVIEQRVARLHQRYLAHAAMPIPARSL